jgi:hypothetical protein
MEKKISGQALRNEVKFLESGFGLIFSQAKPKDLFL